MDFAPFHNPHHCLSSGLGILPRFAWRCHSGFPHGCWASAPGRWVLAHRPGSHPLHSPMPHIARVAPGCRAGTQGSSGQLQQPHRGLHRCPGLCPAPAAHCPAAGYRRVLSREPRPGWSPRLHLGRSAGRIRSKWRWNLQTPETTGRGEREGMGGQRSHRIAPSFNIT